MSKTKSPARHTRGPWHPGQQIDDFVEIDADNWTALASVAVANEDGPSAEGQANARLIFAAPDHAIIARLLTQGKARWEPFPGHDIGGELCFNGLRYTTELDEFGIPGLHQVLRAAIARAEQVTPTAEAKPTLSPEGTK